MWGPTTNYTSGARYATNAADCDKSSMGVERVRACEQGRRFYESLLCHASNTHPHDPALIKQRPGVTHPVVRAARCDLPRFSSTNNCSQHLPSQYLTSKF
ncbi:hypothetical protein CY34DRAFT_233743 [Suillus luteus UH-Slu-Lm8-n1]|uniref:Uncharacterized protein n=1 Tax=Suillus luteus UH-Slu-Lm8-n1 TaxID=930992 RepID=A0A0D0BPA8_9AGAM|nr:hypothetical protein CY34DRAFT_233743 [Suillus luteus UH-Slu-Lm8-n1]